MLSLINLPPEIIIQVLGHLDSFELENFATTCSHFRVFEKERLAEHKRLKSTYGYVCIDPHSPMKELRASASFIYFLSTNSGVCKYPQRLSHRCEYLNAGLSNKCFNGVLNLKDRDKECLPKLQSLDVHPLQRSILPFLCQIAKEARLEIRKLPDFADE